MSVSERQYQGILRVIETLNCSLDSRKIREQAGLELLKLLRADHFASFIWNPDQRRFTGHVFINMDPQNLERYNSYYQFHNPITDKARRLRRAVRVNELVPQNELVRTEFYNDFLARDGLHYGLNLYVYDGDLNIGDLRIWRNCRRENFDSADLEVLDLIRPHFCNSMRNVLRSAREVGHTVPSSAAPTESEVLSIERLSRVHGLTRREAQIALEVAYGKTDREIAKTIGVAFSTVRTHVNHVYEKLGVGTRAGLVRLIYTSF